MRLVYNRLVRIVETTGEPEVVAEFLRGELESERFGPGVRAALERRDVDSRLVTDPDLADAAANELRRELLGDVRSWGQAEGMFGGFPASVRWHRAVLTPDEVASILYIDWDWWLMASGGSRRATDAAERIRRGLLSGVSAGEHERIVARLATGPPLPRLIVVTPPDRSRLVLVDGHARLTGFMLFPESLPPELEVLLGEASGLERWGLF